MKTTYLPLLAVALVAGLGACSGDGGGANSDPDAGWQGGDAGTQDDGGTTTAECDKAANTAHKDALRAAQPALSRPAPATRLKSAITRPVSFASLAGDSAVTCSVDLQFMDLNGNGALDAYENWILPAEERTADLLARMTPAQKMGLMAHATAAEVPSGTTPTVSSALQAMISTGNIRFARTGANTAQPNTRAAWANKVQELAEATPLGVPFVLSSEPAHSNGNGRTKARGFSQWPHELGLAASNDLALVQTYGQVVATELRAIGVRMALSPSADLFTEPRWENGQFTFGEDSAAVGNRVEAFIKGAQGAELGPTSVACVAKHFPGAGPAKDGWDARLEKGRFVAYPGDNLDAHLAPFAKAFDAGAAGVMPGYGIPETGSWTGLQGLVDGATIEQVGASFNAALLTDVLRDHYQFSGLVLAPWGVLEDKGLSPFGAPWGVEGLTRAQRAAKAIGAGVDQFGGLNDAAPIAEARTAGLITDAQIDAAAGRALALMFRLGLFENPYVDATRAAQLVNTDLAMSSGRRALAGSMVLLVNEDKPADWLNGDGDGTQSGDPGNAGNGTGKVLPAPPGAPYIAAGCSYFILGNFDLDYVRGVSTGYGELTNDANSIDSVPVTTPAERIARSDYVFIRVSAPKETDTDSGALNLPTESLEYGSSASSYLADVAAARAAIDALAGSKTQIVVGVDSGRPAVISEILSYGVSGLYLDWGGIDGSTEDEKMFLDVAFGIVDGQSKLPVGLPLSDAAVQDAAQQKEDLPGDGQHPTLTRGAGLSTPRF